jgi:hypothetical protein
MHDRSATRPVVCGPRGCAAGRSRWRSRRWCDVWREGVGSPAGPHDGRFVCSRFGYLDQPVPLQVSAATTGTCSMHGQISVRLTRAPGRERARLRGQQKQEEPQATTRHIQSCHASCRSRWSGLYRSRSHIPRRCWARRSSGVVRRSLLMGGAYPDCYGKSYIVMF